MNCSRAFDLKIKQDEFENDLKMTYQNLGNKKPRNCTVLKGSLEMLTCYFIASTFIYFFLFNSPIFG
jgi:hypothetical protein